MQTHLITSRPAPFGTKAPAPSRRLPAVCAHHSGEHQTCSRRQSLAALVALQAALSTALVAPAQAEEAAPPAAAAAAPAAPVAPKWKNFIGPDFVFTYPPNFKVKEEYFDVDAPRGPRKDTPVKADVSSADGSQHVTVIYQQISTVKQTLLQITDIAQLGTVEEVARLLLPAGSRVAGATVLSFPQPAKDTGTLLGAIERPPRQLYRYEVLLPSGDRAEVCVGVRLGRILLLGATATEDAWAAAAPTLRTIADSFRVLTR